MTCEGFVSYGNILLIVCAGYKYKRLSFPLSPYIMMKVSMVWCVRPRKQAHNALLIVPVLSTLAGPCPAHARRRAVECSSGAAPGWEHGGWVHGSPWVGGSFMRNGTAQVVNEPCKIPEHECLNKS